MTNGLSRRECLWIEAAGKLYPEDKKSAKKAEKKSRAFDERVGVHTSRRCHDVERHGADRLSFGARNS
ncbi:MAG: hypothetical protein IPK15_27315 [Verrucomicrobia bacterium]|nr:hypothetical protein [Verrucomicrobiota bacterium]